MIDIENSFNRLEEINETIRNPKMTLSEAALLFEEGVKLSNLIENELNSLEKRIEILTNPPEDRNEIPNFVSFSDEEK